MRIVPLMQRCQRLEMLGRVNRGGRFRKLARLTIRVLQALTLFSLLILLLLDCVEEAILKLLREQDRSVAFKHWVIHVANLTRRINNS